MRYAVLADVHANLEALSAVLAEARALGAERVACAGDLVGYHADPDACVALLRENDAVCVAGNHDRVAAGVAEPERFGATARRAALWTRACISPESRAFLAALPLSTVVDGHFLLVHGALHPTPNADLRLDGPAPAAESLAALRDGPWGVALAFFGHTHRSLVHEAHGGFQRFYEARMIALSGSSRYLVNPGSVGLSRDGDPRAAFAVLDTEARTVSFHRAAFDGEACLAKAASAGLIEGEGRLARLARAIRRMV